MELVCYVYVLSTHFRTWLYTRFVTHYTYLLFRSKIIIISAYIGKNILPTWHRSPRLLVFFIHPKPYGEFRMYFCTHRFPLELELTTLSLEVIHTILIVPELHVNRSTYILSLLNVTNIVATGNVISVYIYVLIQVSSQVNRIASVCAT